MGSIPKCSNDGALYAIFLADVQYRNTYISPIVIHALERTGAMEIAAFSVLHNI